MNMNIIIVGNGSSVLGKKLGTEIDNFSKVIRLNNFKIEGYEEDVGQKTDIWIHSANNDIEQRNLKNIKNVVIINNRGFWPEEFFEKNKTTFVCFDCYKALDQYELNFNSDYFPSLGIQCILFYLTLFGPITYTGFDSFKTGHYFKEDWKHWSGHNTDIESKILSTLKNKNMLCEL